MTYDPSEEEMAQLAALADSQQPVPASPDSNIGMGAQTPPAGAQVSDDVAAILQGMVQGQQPAEGSYQVAHGAGGGLATPPPPTAPPAAPVPPVNPVAAAQTGMAALLNEKPAEKTPAQLAVEEAVRTGKPVAVPGGQGLTALPTGTLAPEPPKPPTVVVTAPKPGAAAKPVEPPPATPPAAQPPAPAPVPDPNLAPGDQPPSAGTPASTGLGAGDMPPGGPTQQEPQKAEPAPAAPVPAAPAAPGATGPTGAAMPPATTTPGAPGAAAPSPDLAKPVSDVHSWLESRKAGESSGNPDAKNPRSSASGYYGITDGTYQATLARHPELKGQDKNSEAVATAVFSDMKTDLQSRLGHEPTAGEMNASWLLGPAGAAKALQSDQSAPITNVVSAEQLKANPQWLNKDGSPKSVGQVLNEYNSGHTGGAGGGGTGTAVAGATQPGYADLFKMQQARIDAYQQGQGQLFDKLAEMQKAYLQQTKPSVYDQLGDAFTSWAMAHNAAQANQLATTGGVIHHALPNPQPFQQALAAGQAQTNQQRQMMADRAKTNLSFGSDMIKLKAQTDYQSLGLSNDLAKNLVDSQFRQGDQDINRQRLGMEADKIKLELAQFGQSNTEQFNKYLESQVGDPQIRAAITQEALTGGIDTTKSLQSNLPALNGIIQKHAATENISGKQNLMDVTWVDPTTKKTMHDQIDIATPQGKQRIADIKQQGGDSYRGVPLAQGAQINTPITNIMPGAGGAGGKDGGGGGEMTPGKAQEAAMSLQQSAAAAKALIPYIQVHGGASALTDEDGNKVANVIQQLTGIDYSGVAVRTIYDKLMSQVQSGLVLPSLQSLGGRPTGGEFTVFRQGQLGSQSNTVAAAAFLDHVIKTTDYEIRKNDFILDKTDAAKRSNDVNFNLEKELRDWRRQGPQNMPPQWDSQGLIDAARKEQEGAAKAGSGQGGPGQRAVTAGAGKSTAAPAPAATSAVTPQAAAAGVGSDWQVSNKTGVYRSPDGSKYIDRMGVPVNPDGSPLKRAGS